VKTLMMTTTKPSGASQIRLVVRLFFAFSFGR